VEACCVNSSATAFMRHHAVASVLSCGSRAAVVAAARRDTATLHCSGSSATGVNISGCATLSSANLVISQSSSTSLRLVPTPVTVTCHSHCVAIVASHHWIYSSAACQRGIRPQPVCSVLRTLALVAPPAALRPAVAILAQQAAAHCPLMSAIVT
jgi:hypothetical protein